MRRVREEDGFTLIELAAVVVIIGVLIAVALPAFLSFSGSAQTAASSANVRSAIPAAEKMASSNGNYAGISGATLRTAAPGVGPKVKAISLNSNKGYCIEDTESSGTTYDYVGGTPGGWLQAGYKAGVIQVGDCLSAAGAIAS